MKKRYVYACTIIPPEERDIAHRYQEDPEELNPSAEIGDVRQVATTLSEEAVEAYKQASNYIPDSLEEVTEVRALGWEEGPVETPLAMASIAGVQRIPTDASTSYMRSLYMRGEEDLQGAGVVVAVLDTAIGATVAKWLKPYIKAAKSFINGNPVGATTQNHGTHVACVALPDEAKLLHGEVLGPDGSGTMDKVAAGIYWAVENGADIVNISIGGPGGAQTLERAIAYAVSRGVIVRCAGGNEAQRGNTPQYPGACESAEAVGAYDKDTDERAPFSNTGSYIDLAGPGVSEVSYYANGSLGLMSGSSQASPATVWHTACLIGKHKKRGKSAAEISAAIKATARKNGDPATYYGAGIVRGRAADRELSAS